MAEKETISRGAPCKICGKPDYCYRLHHDDGTTEHCCARAGESQIANEFGVFVLNRVKESNIGTYWCYKTVEDKERSRRAWCEAHGKTYTGDAPKVSPSSSPKPVVATKQEVATASAERIDLVYRTLMELLVLEECHEKSLRNDWNTQATKGLFETITGRYPIKSLPPADWVRNGKKFTRSLKNAKRSQIMYELVKKVGTPAGVPGFFVNKYGKWDMAGNEGILIPTVNEKGQLTSLRIREDYPLLNGKLNGIDGSYKHSYEEGADVWTFKPDGDGKEVKVYDRPVGKAAGKYKSFSSNGYEQGVGAGAHYSLCIPSKCDYTKVYVTEGEKKAMVASELLGNPVVSLPGVGTFRLMFESSLVSYLGSKGMKQAIIAYDADKTTNVHVLKAEKAAVQRFIDAGISIAIGEWNGAWSKGLDDTLVQGLRPNIYLVR